MTAERY